MALGTGSRFGPYEVLDTLGAGGMGVVYRARDPRLGRDVALKVLSDALVADPSRVARFEREARTLAALSHPNVGGIHGLETAGGVTALVLELVEGPTLADRLVQGTLPLDEALSVAQQIAAGVQAAHDLGIVHRDLKPANIKIRRDGTVKVLDFGLAKALSNDRYGEDATEADLATHVGTIMGTPAYMSPEQARGEVVDRQSDVWSFGVVLYELLTGESPFRRPTTTDTLASVIGAPPDFGRLPAHVPPAIRRLLRRCLEKDRTRRTRDIGDARLDIEEARAALASGAPSEATPAVDSRGRWWRRAGVASLVVAAGFAGWMVATRSQTEGPDDVAWLSMPFFDSRAVSLFGARFLAISDDGSRVAVMSANRVLIRRMDQAAPVSVNVVGSNPFFAPDGDWVAFFQNAGEHRGLVKVPASGGVPVPIVPTSDRPGGGTWRSDGTIVYATSGGLYEVSANGGEPRLLAKPDAAKKHRQFAWPRFMPDGRSVLFTILTDTIDAASIARLDLETGETTVVLTGGTAPRYMASGRLVYASGRNLMAVAVDPTSMRMLGEPVLLTGVEIANTPDNGAAQFAISETGSLVFVPPTEAGQLSTTLSWIDRSGKEESLRLAPGRYTNPRVSPDGTRIALDMPGDNRDIWIWHERRESLVRLTTGPTEDVIPVWSADGSRVFFSSDRSGNFDVYSQAADGSTDARLEYGGPGAQVVTAFTPDGTSLLLVEDFKDLSLLRLTPPARVEPLRRTESNDWLGEVSRDGGWIAYESDEAGGRVEVFVRPFGDVSGRREQISTGGGRYPKWNPIRPDELFYVDPDGGMRAVSLQLSPELSVGPATKLFDTNRPGPTVSGRPYDVSPTDGRFLVARPATAPLDRRVTVSVVLNWDQELIAKVPTQ
jgi:Tol biopolymer transport system component